MVIDSIRQNIPALQIISQLRQTDNRIQTNLERISTGLRINRPGDDPDGFIKSNTLETQFRGLDQANQNVQEAINLVEVATGAIDEIIEQLNDIRTIAVDAASGGGTAAQQIEVQELIDEIESIASRTRFGNKNLLDGTFDSNASFSSGTRDFGGSIVFGPDATNLLDGTSFLNIAQIQEGSERITTGGDGTVNTGIRLATDIAVTTGQFNDGAGTPGTGDNLTTLTFNQVTLNNPGSFTVSGTLADGSTTFNGSFSITGAEDLNDFITFIQNLIDTSEDSIGIDSGGGTNALETNVQLNTATGRLEFFSGQSGTPSEFDIHFTVFNGSNEQTSAGITRASTITNVEFGGTASGAQIGNSVTAITGSTFDSGEFTIEVTSVESAAQRVVVTDLAFTEDAPGTDPVEAADNIRDAFLNGVSIEVNDTLELIGTDPDGTTFTTTFTVEGAGPPPTEGSALVQTFQDLIDELNLRDRSNTGFGFNGAVATLTTSGLIQLQDDVADNSSTNIEFIFTDVSDPTTVSIGSNVTTEGNPERATITLDSGDSVLVNAGEVITLEGGNANEDGSTPQLTLRLGDNLQAGDDEIRITANLFEGSLNSGQTVQFKSGQEGVTFFSGSRATGSINRFQFVTLDFDAIVDVTSTPDDGGEIFTIKSSSNELTFEISGDGKEERNLVLADLRPENLGISANQTLEDIDVTSVSGANEAIEIVDAALDQVNAVSARLGAFSSRLEATSQELIGTSLNIQTARNTIVSADIAKETTELTLNTILLEAQSAVLVQANTTPTQVFEILFGLDS